MLRSVRRSSARWLRHDSLPLRAAALCLAALALGGIACAPSTPRQEAKPAEVAAPGTPPVVGLLTFVGRQNVVVAQAWNSVDATLEAQPGHIRSRMYRTSDDSATYAMVHITTWDDAGSLATALLETGAALSAAAPKGASALYVPSAAGGNIRDSLTSSVMIIVPFDTPSDSAGAWRAYQLVDQFLAPQPGFVGSVLLRRSAGQGGYANVILSRWASRAQAEAVLGSQVGRTLVEAAGIVSRPGFYVADRE